MLYHFGYREEESEVAIFHRSDRGRVRRVQRKVGVGRGEPAALQGIGVSVHTAAADVSRARPAGEGLPVLAMATSRLFSSKVYIYAF